MSRSQRLSLALHVLLHMAEAPERPMTSEAMAACVGTNPVVVRRTFAGLREAGIVNAIKGHGGGWRLAHPPAAISLAAIQQALGERLVPPATPPEPPRCLVLRAVFHALDDALAEAEAVIDRRLSTLTLADLATQVGARPGGHSHAHAL